MSRLKWLTALLVQHYEGFHPDLVALNRQPTNQRRVKREIYRKHRRNAPSLRSTTQFFSHLFVYLSFFSILLACLVPRQRENDPKTILELLFNLLESSLINEESDRLASIAKMFN